MDFWNRSSKQHQEIVEPQPKRISTPAGQRLSVILENGDSHASKARDSHRASVRKSGLSPALADAPRESLEDNSNNSSGYSFSVWSDGEKKFAALRNHKQIAKRGGWKRLAIILAILVAIIIALAVGLAVGLKKKKTSRYGEDAAPVCTSDRLTATSSTTDDPQQASDPTASLSPTSPSSPTSTSTISVPPDFPLGSYSLVTFLDTVQTNCTANPATWTCYPYSTYYSDRSKAVATFNWIISGSAGAYTISSTENPFSISFKNADFELLDEGKDTERYRFQISSTKTVTPSTNLTDDNASTECNFDNTDLQAYLYTKMAKSYPDTEHGDPTGDPSSTVWPFGKPS